jgi:hypothetical protein
MGTLKSHKLNHLLQKAPPNAVITSQFLAENSIPKELARKYVTSDWLTRIGRGAYIRSGDTVDWQGALYAMQSQLGLTVHTGGLTALQMKGLGHYLPMAEETIHLFSDGPERLPDWFKRYDWGTSIEHHSGVLFDLSASASLSSMQHKGFEIQISTPERAAFEMLSLVKTNDDFDAGRTVFDGLTSLRPKEVQRLLTACRSVRVKRTFLWMAKDCGHPWVKHLDLSGVDLGKGKRAIYRNGRLDKEYQITVPRDSGEAHV